MPTDLIDQSWLTLFLLVLVRTSAWVMATPLLGTRALSAGRIALAVGLSVVLTPVAHRAGFTPGDGIGWWVTAAIGEAIAGLALGLVTGLVLQVGEIAGALADAQSGLGFSMTLNPASGMSAALMQRLFGFTTLAVAFATDAHLVLLDAFARTFRAWPVGDTPELANAGLPLGHLVTEIVIGGLLIAAPIIGVMFLVDVVLAVLSRFVPQASPFNVGLPVKIGVALMLVGSCLILLPSRMPGLIDGAISAVGEVLR